VLDLAGLFELPAWHPDRTIAAQTVAYIGLVIHYHNHIGCGLEPLEGGVSMTVCSLSLRCRCHVHAAAHARAAGRGDASDIDAGVPGFHLS
jgi:hypothetical protein